MAVRIKHDTATSAVYRVEDPTVPYTTPYYCWTCLETHTNKTYHLFLDSNGECVVGTNIYTILLTIAGGIDLSGIAMTVLNLLEPPVDMNLAQGGNWVQWSLV